MPCGARAPHGNPQPQFIRSTRRSAGVRNGYVQTWRLGADRWVAMLGPGLHPGRALCVVDVGTALTLDLLDADGQHRGGLLVPGPTLMVESLLSNTAGIRRRAGLRATRKRAPQGRTFAAALARACWPERRGLCRIDRACAGEARATLRARPKLLLAGAPRCRWLRPCVCPMPEPITWCCRTGAACVARFPLNNACAPWS